jgi:hypothetical protein
MDELIASDLAGHGRLRVRGITELPNGPPAKYAEVVAPPGQRRVATASFGSTPGYDTVGLPPPGFEPGMEVLQI